MKKTIIALAILFAIPIPISLLGCLLSFGWIMLSANERYIFVEIIAAFFGVIIGGTYSYTYLAAFTKSWSEKRISKRTFLPLVHCIVALAYLLTLSPLAEYVGETTKRFGFSKRDYIVVEEYNTHGGFLGEGETILILDCSVEKEKASEIIKDWNKLPLSENLDKLLYDGHLAKDANIPKVENGYYIFEDRHHDSTDSKDDSELFDRGSFNLSMAIYDCDTDKMYYYELDT